MGSDCIVPDYCLLSRGVRRCVLGVYSLPISIGYTYFFKLLDIPTH